LQSFKNFFSCILSTLNIPTFLFRCENCHRFEFHWSLSQIIYVHQAESRH
jgi:hypothetical protein